MALFVEWLNVPVFTLLTQLEYSQRGMATEGTVADRGPEYGKTITLYNRIDYISVPIFAKIRFQTEAATPYLLIGPRIDFLLHKDSDLNAYQTIDDRLKKTILGASVGVGIQIISLSSINGSVELRYNLDLQDSYSTDLLTIHNNAFDLWFGISI